MAMDLLRREVENGGANARSAQFQLARLAKESGDETTANREWAALARRDSIGYYGTIAREAAGLPAPTFLSPPRRTPSRRVEQELAVLDLLSAARLDREAEVLLESLTTPDGWELEGNF